MASADHQQLTSFGQLVDKLFQMVLIELEERPQRFLIDLSLLFCFLYIVFSKSYKIPKETKLTPEEVNELLDEWTPEPLIPTQNNKKSKKNQTSVLDDPDNRLVTSALQSSFTMEGRREPVLNFASYNFLGLAGDKSIIAECKKTITKYGVGSCGPRGFYGTIDVHLDLEKKLAEFMGTDGAIVYSYGFCTVSSVIPAFSKRGDVILYDQGVNFATLQGIDLSRTSAQPFKHNDTNDLERLLKQICAKDKGGIVKNRRFIVINGVYENYGDIAQLKQIVELKNKYKFRLIMDDSFGFGVLGRHGRGTAEHFGIDIQEVDILTANLENALAAVGGFCVGSKQVVEHQRLSGLGYCFSASLPPFTSTATIESVKRLQQHPDLVKQLSKNIRLTFDTLNDALPECLRLDGSYNTPLMHIRYKGTSDTKVTLALFQQVVAKALDNNVALVCPKYSSKEANLPAPSIRIAISAAHTETDIQRCTSTLKTALTEVFV